MQLWGPVVWDQSKNELLKKERGISFEDIVAVIEQGGILHIEPNVNQKRYPGQFRMIVNVGGYACIVPFVIDRQCEHTFLKTIIPSRKFTKKFLQDSQQ